MTTTKQTVSQNDKQSKTRSKEASHATDSLTVYDGYLGAIQRLKIVPTTLTRSDVLLLQRTLGNQALGQLARDTDQHNIKSLDTLTVSDMGMEHSIQNTAYGGQEITDTVDRHIYFKTDEYQPDTSDGRKLLTHELSHLSRHNSKQVIQRGGDKDRQLSKSTQLSLPEGVNIQWDGNSFLVRVSWLFEHGAPSKQKDFIVPELNRQLFENLTSVPRFWWLQRMSDEEKDYAINHLMISGPLTLANRNKVIKLGISASIYNLIGLPPNVGFEWEIFSNKAICYIRTEILEQADNGITLSASLRRRIFEELAERCGIPLDSSILKNPFTFPTLKGKLLARSFSCTKKELKEVFGPQWEAFPGRVNEGDPSNVHGTGPSGYKTEFKSKGKGRKYQFPPLPAQLEGLSSQPVGGSGVYQMQLDYSAADEDQLAQMSWRMQFVHYRWELWSIAGAPDLKEREQQVRGGNLAGEGASGRRVGAFEGTGRNFERVGEDLAKRPGQINADQAEAVQEKRYLDALANELNRNLLSLEVISKYGGALVSAAADLINDGSEQEIPWRQSGVYVIRCIAAINPGASKDEPARAPSVATKVVQVQPVEKISQEAIDAPEEQIAKLELQIALRESLPKDDPGRLALSELQQQLVDAKIEARGTPLEVIAHRLQVKQRELAIERQNSPLLKVGMFDRHVSMLEREVGDLQKQLNLARNRANELSDMGSISVPPQRVHGVLVSRVTGQTYHLLLQIQEPQLDGNIWTCFLSDVTSPQRGKYIGKWPNDPRNPEVAKFRSVTEAIERLASEAEYGEGSLTIRLPAQGWFAKLEDKKRYQTIESRPRDLTAARERLEELGQVVALLGLVVTSPAIGFAGAGLSAALAGDRIARRIMDGTFHWDDWQNVEDVMDILSAVAVAVSTGAQAALGSLEAVSDGGGFLLRLRKTAGIAHQAAEMTDKALDIAGIIHCNAKTIDQLIEIINNSDPSMTQTQRRREIAQVITGAIQSNGLWFASKLRSASQEGHLTNEDTQHTKQEDEPTKLPHESEEKSVKSVEDASHKAKPEDRADEVDAITGPQHTRQEGEQAGLPDENKEKFAKSHEGELPKVKPEHQLDGTDSKNKSPVPELDKTLPPIEQSNSRSTDGTDQRSAEVDLEKAQIVRDAVGEFDALPEMTVTMPLARQDASPQEQLRYVRDAQMIFENTWRGSTDDSPHARQQALSKEVALYRNPLTGEFIIVQGVTDTVYVEMVDGKPQAPQGAGTTQRWKEILDGLDVGHWELVIHSHPIDPQTGTVSNVNRFPSGANADFGNIVWASQMARRQPRSSRITYETQTGPNHTDFGYNPSSSTPFWVDYPDPNTGKRHRLQFPTLEVYHEWLRNTFNVAQGAVPEWIQKFTSQSSEGNEPVDEQAKAPEKSPGTIAANDVGTNSSKTKSSNAFEPAVLREVKELSRLGAELEGQILSLELSFYDPKSGLNKGQILRSIQEVRRDLTARRHEIQENIETFSEEYSNDDLEVEIENTFRDTVDTLQTRLLELKNSIPVQEPEQTLLSQEGGLIATEGAVILYQDGQSRPAHPLDHGPDVDPNYLRNQVRSPEHSRTIAAKFLDRVTMERVIHEFINKTFADAIATWLKTAPPGDKFVEDYTPGNENLGMGFYKNPNTKRVEEIPTDKYPLNTVRIILIATGGQPVQLADSSIIKGRSYIIQTAFPINLELVDPIRREVKN